MKLDFCNYLLKTISLNCDFEKDLEMKKEINNDAFQIHNRIIMLVLKDKIKNEFNNYLLLKEKLKHDKNNKKENNEINNIINNINFKQFISLIKSLGIKQDNLNNHELNDLIEEIKNNQFIKILNNLFKNKEAIDFLFSITSQDCRNIQELAGEVHGGNNQNFLSIEELLLIEKIVESFEYVKNEIKNNKNRNEEEIIITNILNQIEEEDLEKYLNKYQQYKEFFSENLDKKKFTAEVIQKILNKSEFLILNSNDNNFKAFYKNEDNKEKEIYKGFDYNYMIYLRDRALTRNKINDSILNKEDEFIKNLKEEEKIIFENNKTFVEIVHQINELMKLLNKIAQKGFLFYFNDKDNYNYKSDNNKNIFSDFENIDKINNILLFKIKIKIEKENDCYKTTFLLNGEEYNNYYEINETIKNIYDNIENIQRNAYLKKKIYKFHSWKTIPIIFGLFP